MAEPLSGQRATATEVDMVLDMRPPRRVVEPERGRIAPDGVDLLLARVVAVARHHHIHAELAVQPAFQEGPSGLLEQERRAKRGFRRGGTHQSLGCGFVPAPFGEDLRRQEGQPRSEPRRRTALGRKRARSVVRGVVQRSFWGVKGRGSALGTAVSCRAAGFVGSELPTASLSCSSDARLA